MTKTIMEQEITEEDIKKGNFKFIHDTKSDMVAIQDLDTLKYHDAPIAGFYDIECQESMMGSMFTLKIYKPELPKNSEYTAKTILDLKELDLMFSEDSKRIHAAMAAAAKIGYMLYGKQGTGKTTAAYSVGQYCVDKYGAAIFLVYDANDVQFAFKSIKNFRKMEPNMMAVIIFDECEDAMRNSETNMKRLLDSQETPTNMLFIATTNYLDKVPETIKDRPSRFKHLFDCSDLNVDESVVFEHFVKMNENLQESDKLSDAEIRTLTPTGKGKTIDELKHMFIDHALSKFSDSGALKKKVRTTGSEELV